MSKVIVITPGGNMTINDYPSGSDREQIEMLRRMIGENCRTLEHVMPARLYTVLGGYIEYPSNGRCRPNMLVDEDGMYHDLEVNEVGSWLYQADAHGCPILGNIVIAGETASLDGLEFIGLSDDQFKLLKPRLEEICMHVRQIRK